MSLQVPFPALALPALLGTASTEAQTMTLWPGALAVRPEDVPLDPLAPLWLESLASAFLLGQEVFPTLWQHI